MGNISVSFYMIHLPVQHWFSWSLGYDHKVLPGWGIAATLVTSLMLGWFLARYVEDMAKNLFAQNPNESSSCTKGVKQVASSEPGENERSQSEVVPEKEERDSN